MGKVVETVRRHAVVAGVGGALLLTGVGFGAAAVSDSPDTREVADVADVTTPTTSTASEPTTTAEPAPPAGDTRAASIDAVTPSPEPAPADIPADSPAPVPAPDPDPAPAPNQGVGTIGENGRYTPAPVQPNPGEPPVNDPGAIMAPVQPMPGEPGYVPPAG